MTVPALPAKLTIPTSPAYLLRRPRLDARWDSWSRLRLVLVTAGAGFGKSSFLADNAIRSHRPAVWFTVDDLDVDPTAFYGHLAHAFEPLNGESLPLPESNHPEFPHRLLSQMVRVLRAQDPGAVLILDDVHLISGSGEQIRFLDRLIRNAPETSTIILASREPVEIPVMKLKAHGLADSISARDLEFTEDEVQELFRRHYPGETLTNILCRRIRESTEGWAAGLEILFQALPGPEDDEVAHTLDRLCSAGSGWFAFFAEEVLSRLDAETRDFLLGSSILPRLEPELCDKVLGLRNSRAILDRLRQRNLFIYTTDGDRAGYRYHRLFREFLQEQLVRTFGDEECSSLRRTAASALESRGDWVEALLAHAESEDHASALDLIRRKGRALVETGQYRLLEQALDRIPRARILESFHSSLFRGTIHDDLGRWKTAMEFYQSAWDLCNSQSGRQELLTRMATLHLRWGQYARCRELCLRALKSPGRNLHRARAMINEMLGVAASEMGDLEESRKYLEQSREDWRHAGNPVQEAYLLSLIAANVYAPRGDFTTARRLAREALAEQTRLQSGRTLCHALAVLAFLTSEGLLEREARSLAGRALRLAEALEYAVMIALCRHVLGKCAFLAGNLDEARDRLQSGLDLATQLGEVELSMLPRLGLAEVELAAGNRHAARRHADELIQRALASGDRLQECQGLNLLGRIEESTDPAEARKHWRRAEEVARSVGALFDLHRALLCRLDTGDVPADETARLLEELVAGTARLEHDRLFTLLEPERSVRVLSTALARGIEVPFTTRTLVALGERAAPALARIATDTTRAGRAARRAAVRLERASQTPMQIQAFGALRVRIGHREIAHDDWGSRRALRLFQYLLIHRFRWVTREQIVEALWPDTEASRSSNNLRQSLHLLRGILEPDLDKAVRSAYVLARAEACRLDPGDGYTYDVEQFEELLRISDQDMRAGHGRKAARQLRGAIDLYTGEFFAETPYEEFAASERECLRDSLLQALEQLLSIHAGNRFWKEMIPLCRFGLQQDPYNESLHYHVIRAQVELGHRKEALSDYHRYEATIGGEMGLLPDPRIKALAERIISWSGRGVFPC